eukprot:2147509-Rhodomonas_salina.1
MVCLRWGWCWNGAVLCDGGERVPGRRPRRGQEAIPPGTPPSLAPFPLACCRVFVGRAARGGNMACGVDEFVSGHWHDAEQKKLNRLASSRIFSELNADITQTRSRPPPSSQPRFLFRVGKSVLCCVETERIDLHQLHVVEALSVLEQHMTELAQMACRQQLLVDVICGRGNHSARGVARIAPEVLVRVSALSTFPQRIWILQCDVWVASVRGPKVTWEGVQ